MEPLNKTQRKEATRNFLFVNGLLVVLFLLATYLLFASPMRVLNHHLQYYQQDEDQQQDLNQKVKGIHSDITALVQNDKDRLTASATDIEGQASLQTKKANLEDNIRSTLENIKNDTAKALRPIVLTNYENYIQLLDVTLNYRKTIDYLQGAIADANAKSATMDDANRKLSEDNSQLKTANMIASATKSAGGGGGGDAGTQKLLADKDAQIKDLTDKYNACSTALNQYKTYRGIPPAGGGAATGAQGGASTSSVLFDEANDLLQKGKAETSPSYQDSYYFVAQQILLKIKPTYPDQNAWRSKYTEVQNAIKQQGKF